ncbi:hypothetical protein OUZ56_014049 [Daphnia magna]|uniref:Uncharacterized protein n=1 Tax=Daphnia magna TaxID=35525 RepID=A0ABQ9Z7R0_9CRUS|nr:hypothetical protein OUZ56_014049 [Daphnia magna]
MDVLTERVVPIKIPVACLHAVTSPHAAFHCSHTKKEQYSFITRKIIGPTSSKFFAKLDDADSIFESFMVTV